MYDSILFCSFHSLIWPIVDVAFQSIFSLETSPNSDCRGDGAVWRHLRESRKSFDAADDYLISTPCCRLHVGLQTANWTDIDKDEDFVVVCKQCKAAEKNSNMSSSA